MSSALPLMDPAEVAARFVPEETHVFGWDEKESFFLATSGDLLRALECRDDEVRLHSERDVGGVIRQLMHEYLGDGDEMVDLARRVAREGFVDRDRVGAIVLVLPLR